MAEKAKDGTLQIEDKFDATWREEQWGNRRLSVAAHDLAAEEKSMTTWQAVRANPAAITWSLVISTCVIMEGFDTALLGNFWAYPSFQRKFGDFVGVTPTTRSGYQIPAAWQTGLGQASGVGAFFGAILNGWLVTAFGPRRVLIGSLFTLSACLFIVFFAPSRIVLLVGQFLCGFPWGVFATSAPAYASEVLPLQLRVYFTSFTNMCFIIGQLIAGGVLRGLVTREDSWGYRIPFALQWVWPVFLIPAIWMAPESPWYLVRHNRLDEAAASIRRLQRNSLRIDPKDTLATIGFELRRTEIACMVFGGQLVCGSVFAYASTYFFEQVGLDSKAAYSLGVGANGLALFACLVNWFLLMPYFGRRTIYIWGMGFMTIELLLIAIVFVWAYFRLPETKDRSFHELDILFAKKVSARKFAKTDVDSFDEAEADRLAAEYSYLGKPRPSIIPSVTDHLANHGRASDAAAQRRASSVGADGHTSRRPSIAPAVAEYLSKH